MMREELLAPIDRMMAAESAYYGFFHIKSKA